MGRALQRGPDLVQVEQAAQHLVAHAFGLRLAEHTYGFHQLHAKTHGQRVARGEA